jgi:hypothetical protein
LEPEVCNTCYWASPEKYEHIAMEDIRRTDISWQGGEVAVHDLLRKQAQNQGITVAELLKKMAQKNTI